MIRTAPTSTAKTVTPAPSALDAFPSIRDARTMLQSRLGRTAKLQPPLRPFTARGPHVSSLLP